MTPKELQASLHSGRRVYGTFIASTSPRWPSSVAQIGLDFVFIDTEHVPLDRETLSWMCQTYAGLGLPPIVRIPSPDPYAACMALDAGAAGIIAPYVETVEEVRQLRGAVKLRPVKGARLQAVLEGRAAFEPALASYQQAHHAEKLLIINVESRPAMDNLDDLLAVEGLDSVLIGPHDLSCSLGVPEQYDAPVFEEAVVTIFKKARARNVGAGIHSWMGIEREIAWAAAGLNFIIHSGDIIAMRESLGADISRLRQTLDGAARKQGDAAENI